MALIKCKECGKDISDTTKQCPYCGFKEKISKKWLIIIILGLAVLIAGVGFITLTMLNHNSNTDEEIELTYQEQMVVECLLDYKYKLKNPESLQVFDIRWRDMSAVEDEGDMAIYIDVAGQNSFGGNTRNVILYAIQSGEIVYGGSSDDLDSDNYLEALSAQIIREDYPTLVQDDSAKISVERVMSKVNNN